MSCGVGCRHGLHPTLLWLWYRPVATAPIRSLSWEPPYAVGAALEKAKGQQQQKKLYCHTFYILIGNATGIDFFSLLFDGANIIFSCRQMIVPALLIENVILPPL